MLFKVGPVAKKIGVTVRALHHYDEIGLLSPSHHSASGYRLYTPEDLMQLQKIKSLQQLGFSLEEIQRLMSPAEISLTEVLSRHIQKLTLEVEQQKTLIIRLQQLANKLEQNEQPSVELLFDTLKETVMYDKYYSEEQKKQLAERRKQFSDKDMLDAQQEWQMVFEKFKTLHQSGAPASCKEAQALAKRSLELIELFTGGDPGLRQSLQNMYDKEGGDRVLSQGGWDVDKAIFAYFSEAMELAKKS